MNDDYKSLEHTIRNIQTKVEETTVENKSLEHTIRDIRENYISVGKKTSKFEGLTKGKVYGDRVQPITHHAVQPKQPKGNEALEKAKETISALAKEESSFADRTTKPIDEKKKKVDEEEPRIQSEMNVNVSGQGKFTGGQFTAASRSHPGHITPHGHSDKGEIAGSYRKRAKEKAGLNRIAEGAAEKLVMPALRYGSKLAKPYIDDILRMPKGGLPKVKPVEPEPIAPEKPSIPDSTPPTKVPPSETPKPANDPGAPSPKPSEKPSEKPVETPGQQPSTKPKVAPGVAPNVAPETSPKVSPKVAPGVAPETAPEVKPKTLPVPSPETLLAPSPAPKTAAEPAPKAPEGSFKPSFRLPGNVDTTSIDYKDYLYRPKRNIGHAEPHKKHGPVKEEVADKIRKKIQNMPRKDAGDRKTIEYVGRTDAEPKTAKEKTSRLATIKNVIDEAKKIKYEAESGKEKKYFYPNGTEVVIGPDMKRNFLDAEEKKLSKDYENK